MASITTIQATDVIATSRTDINTNFANLNSDKIETSYLDTDTSLTANSDTKIPSQKAVKAYVDSGGQSNASETVRGLVEEATDAEVTAGTATGATGAKLFVTPTKLNTFIKPTTVRTYNLADSPATWTKPANLKAILVHAWGGGGSGASKASDAGGGGGGAFNEAFIPVSVLGATETVTVGAGGAVSADAVGKVGGNSSFGTLVTAYGGGGGVYSSTGGGGGGRNSNGGVVGAGGGLLGGAVGSGSKGGDSTFGGGGGGATTFGGGSSIYGGGGGGGSEGGGTGLGGSSVWGGGGGGGSSSDGVGEVGGTSIFGGAGGNGGDASPVPTAGAVPGGGGGGNQTTANSGAGGAGRVIVYEIY
jgi:hypothetical protein